MAANYHPSQESQVSRIEICKKINRLLFIELINNVLILLQALYGMIHHEHG